MNYTIKPGDTLKKIARAHGITLAVLLDLNPRYKVNPDSIRVGDKLQLSATPPAQTDQLLSQPHGTDEALGSLSEKYETGGRGPGTVSSGVGDAGGVSYGSYQMTSKGGGTVARFVSQPDFPWPDDFKNLTPGSEAFTRKWQEIARTHPAEFQASQHGFIKKTHYDPLVAKIKMDDNLDITTRSFALQNVIWSTAVQHGPNASVVHRAFNALQNNGAPSSVDPAFDQKLIKAIYAERGRKDAQGNLVYFSRNSRTVQQGVARRFIDEERDALRMLENEAGQ